MAFADKKVAVQVTHWKKQTKQKTVLHLQWTSTQKLTWPDTTDERNINISHSFLLCALSLATSLYYPRMCCHTTGNMLPAPSFTQARKQQIRLRAGTLRLWQEALRTEFAVQIPISHVRCRKGCKLAGSQLNHIDLSDSSDLIMKWIKVKKTHYNSDSFNFLLRFYLKYFYHLLTWPLQWLLN